MNNPNEMSSKWRFYSFATAAENKKLGAHELEVNLLEMSAFLNGAQTNRGVKETYDYTDASGVAKSGSEVTSGSVPATWKCDDGQRITPPDVRRGEELIIMQFGDSEQLFWTPRNTNRHLRKLETVTYAFSGTTDENDKTVTEDNHYLLEVSTHKGHVVLKTSDANGEVCRWNIEVRGKDGVLLVGDNNNNEVMMNSQEKHIRLLNGDDTYVEVIKKNINLSGVGDLNVTMKGNINFSVEGNADIKVKGKATLAASDYTVTSPNVLFTGNVNIAGGLTAKTANFPGGHGPH